MTNTVDATFYVQIKPQFFLSGTHVSKASAVVMTQTKPRAPKGGTVMVKLTVRIPESAFLPLRPEAVITIPEGMVLAEPIEVEAEDPS